ncbi:MULTISPECIES: pyridoxamine 5'-phosphate oxidase family protein [Clostridium]|uniref:Pyridoxamine 5'-phosphate oxidase n=1 Tax=Clostridium ragsdalei P11 TaxID=1353534 RepID=A0A1A6AQJ8_9CLOT|nr:MULTISPECIES: pyridoxamine 5'-phosphate oxidase family protein [Clostridium]OBR92332.1 pyridoxamine 5'-phosphate oxidase [Clostridium ragsdalei P11]QXE17745.1 pyridoxamine 5'-phosphate oxidase [Clostridium sp. 001]
MNEVVKFLKENPVQYFATVGLDGKPKVRPFQFMLEKDGNLYFCTNNKKDVFAQLQKCPYVEISTSSPKFAWIRLNGKVVFSNDMETKKAIIESSSLVKSLYKSAENPIFEIFYLKDAKAVIADFSGNPPKEYAL